MKIKFYVLTLLIIAESCCTLFAQPNVSWFYPWETNLNKLVTDKSDFIPINRGGKNYRIVKIDNFNGSKIKSVQFNNNGLGLTLSELPVLKNYHGNNIVDVVLPIIANHKLENTISTTSRYFLVLLKGYNSGKKDFSIILTTDKASYTIKNTAIVGKSAYTRNISLNTWPYFDYNFMLKGTKSSMIDNLQSLGANVLVIPPYVLPHITDKSRPNNLIDYLSGAKNKFNYYIIYFGGFQAKSNNFCSTTWYVSYPAWIKNLTSEMNALGIRQDQILLYPIDEPKGENIGKLDQIISFSKKNGITNSFFSTAENNMALDKMTAIKYGQLHTGQGNLENAKVRSRASSNNNTWIYETRFGRSREQSPVNYLRLGWKASLLGATGIGMWNFCDVRDAYSSAQQNRILQGTPSWWIIPQNPGYDSSIVYRKGSSLFSSLRGLALSSALEEVFWLKLYRSKNGASATNRLLNNLISGSLDYSDLEAIKCKLIN
ncbi:hypothetical protein [Sphingobacterium thalpophilum]|uniref:hypothetical protein n=1 Tax=Sphingobacterium thalpophilum TaxID=259 RepID=UPI002D79D2DC|nr:hypothetical protein [Sphingobacterium thalpophilum]